MSVFSSPFKEPFHNPFGSPFNGPGVGGGGGAAPAWNPVLWFLASEQGIWLDPSDFDRYIKGKGPEILTNGDFAAGGTGWSLATGWSVTGGKATFVGGTPGYLSWMSGIVVGNYYEMTFTVSDVVGNGSAACYIGGSPALGSRNSSGTYTFRGIATGTGSLGFAIRGNSSDPASSISISNVSVRELTDIASATMFQDSTGTTPVTAVEQPVGLILDKRLGLIPGSELFATAAPNHASVTYTGGVATFTASSTGVGVIRSNGAMPGKWLKATLRVVSVSGGTIRFYAGSGSIGLSITTPGTYTCIVASSGTTAATIIAIGASVNAVVDQIDVRELPGNHAFQATAGSRPALSARKNKLLATTTLATQSVTLTASPCTLSFKGTGTVTLTGASTAGPLVGTGAGDRVSLTFTPTAGSVTFTVSGSVTEAQLEDGSAFTTYQRVNTATDYDSVGFPHYLKFDGVDDFLVTNPIDFSGTDKMTVVAGVRKLSDAVRGIVCELSATLTTGSFSMAAPNSAAAKDISFGSRGTTLVTVDTVSVAPVTLVATGIGDISADVTNLRVNGVLAASSTADQGNSNYGNHPLYIGSRAGTTLPFNGQLNQLIARGALSSDLAAAETFTADKTRDTL